MSFQTLALAGADGRRQIIDTYNRETGSNIRLFAIGRLVPEFSWTASNEHFGEYKNDVTISLGMLGHSSYLMIQTHSSTGGVKNYICEFLNSLGFVTEIVDFCRLKVTLNSRVNIGWSDIENRPTAVTAQLNRIECSTARTEASSASTNTIAHRIEENQNRV